MFINKMSIDNISINNFRTWIIDNYEINSKYLLLSSISRLLLLQRSNFIKKYNNKICKRLNDNYFSESLSTNIFIKYLYKYFRSVS